MRKKEKAGLRMKGCDRSDGRNDGIVCARNIIRRHSGNNVKGQGLPRSWEMKSSL